MPATTIVPNTKSDNDKPINDTQTDLKINAQSGANSSPAIISPNDLPLAYISSNRLFTNTDDRPHALITTNKVEHIMLLDSGSQITVVGTNWIDKLMPNWQKKMTPSHFNITTVDEKAKYAPIGMVDIMYSYMGLTRKVPTIILSVDTRHPILGKTFLTAFDIDFARRTADGWSSIPTFAVEAGTSNKVNVTTLEDPIHSPLVNLLAG